MPGDPILCKQMPICKLLSCSFEPFVTTKRLSIHVGCLFARSIVFLEYCWNVGRSEKSLQQSVIPGETTCDGEMHYPNTLVDKCRRIPWA